MKRSAALLLILIGLSGFLWAQQPAPPVREIKMSAMKYAFDPEEVRVKQGERVRLLITATDRDHGIEIKELGVKVRLEEGKETPVEFTADKAGEYEFKCSVRCGWRHGSMKGKLIVEPTTGAAVSTPKCIHCPQPECTEEARRARQQGIVLLRAAIDEKGLVRDVRVAKSLGHGWDEQAVRTVRKWRYKPAERDGKPVDANVTIAVEFKLY